MEPDPLKAIFSGISSISDSDCQQQAEDGSQDLFSSQSSAQIHNGIDITLQLTENIWVQCDNPDCQKWRKIPVDSFDNSDDAAWFCCMNPDPRMNKCSAPEEDHAQYDRMARKAGIKFVMSTLQAGALVWAKIAGYCSWPAVVTLDPDMGVCVWLDVDGDPSSYHVEFLGNPHTHSWVTAKCIEVYGHKKVQTGLDGQDSQKAAVDRRKSGKVRNKKITVASQSKRRQRFKNMHINAVITEADFLMRLEPQERLTYCTFKPKPVTARNSSKENKRNRENIHDKCKSCGQHKKSRVNEAGLVRTKRTVKQSYRFKKRYSNSGDKNCITRQGSENSVELSTDEGISVPTVKSDQDSTYGFDSPDQFSQSNLKFKNPLKNKTKEEKFTLDINMYRKNEQAFEHDVRRFMSRNGLKIRSFPLWHNVPVRIFQLFLAVYERGGYEKVTQKKQWTSVYRETTEQQHVTSGTAAKLYYQRNLLPYELYIKGKDYMTALKGFCKRKTRKFGAKKDITRTAKMPENEKPTLPTDETSETTKNTDQKASKLFDDSQSKSSSEDIQQLLGQLGDELDVVILQPDTEKNTRTAFGVKFHDDSTESSCMKYANAATEFQGANAEEHDTSGNDMSLGEVENKILHEMKALEDDLTEMNKELENM